jgi:hypothetical protein
MSTCLIKNSLKKAKYWTANLGKKEALTEINP